MTSEMHAVDEQAARYVLDTSVFVGVEQGRLAALPTDGQMAVSVITLGELQLGVLHARSIESRSQRMKTLASAQGLTCLGIDAVVSDEWAALVAEARSHGRRPKPNDTWIAAVARANGATVVTQDSDFDDLDVDSVRL